MKHIVTKLEYVGPQYLAERTGISLSAAKRFLNGTSNPRVSTIMKISKGLRLGPTVVLMTYIRLSQRDDGYCGGYPMGDNNLPYG